MNSPLLKFTTFTLFLLLIGLPKGDIKAQDHPSSPFIIPGSEELQLQYLHAYSYTFELQMISGEQKIPIGTLSDEIRVWEEENMVERVQILKRPNQSEHIDSVRAALNSLIPMSHSSVNANRTISLTYNSKGVTGSFQPSASSPVAVHETFDHPYFDSNWIDLLVRLLPLKEGYQKILQAHEVGPDGNSMLVPYHIRVVKKTTLTDAQGNMQTAWVINQIKEDGLTVFYLKENSLELIKTEIPISDNRKMVMIRKS